MKEHGIGGNFVVKYFGMDGEAIVHFPQSSAEWSEAYKTGIKVVGPLKADGKREEKLFPCNSEKRDSWSYRGFSLQHQGAELLSPEEKAKRKAMRAEESKTKADAKKAGMTPDDIAAIIKAEIARRSAAKKPA